MNIIKSMPDMTRTELQSALEQANVGARAQAEAMTELGKLTEMQMKRIAELEEKLSWLSDPAKVHTNILRGTIALTKAQAIHIAGLPANVEARIAALEAALRVIAEHQGRCIYSLGQEFREGSNAAFEEMAHIAESALNPPAAATEPKP